MICVRVRIELADVGASTDKCRTKREKGDKPKQEAFPSSPSPVALLCFHRKSSTNFSYVAAQQTRKSALVARMR